MVKGWISVYWAGPRETGRDFLCFSSYKQYAPVYQPATERIVWFSIIAGDVNLF